MTDQEEYEETSEYWGWPEATLGIVVALCFTAIMLALILR